MDIERIRKGLQRLDQAESLLSEAEELFGKIRISFEIQKRFGEYRENVLRETAICYVALMLMKGEWNRIVFHISPHVPRIILCGNTTVYTLIAARNKSEVLITTNGNDRPAVIKADDAIDAVYYNGEVRFKAFINWRDAYAWCDIISGIKTQESGSPYNLSNKIVCDWI
ncbi:MAG: hypothetical protein WC477_06665 [Patescibacteria group bacterium]